MRPLPSLPPLLALLLLTLLGACSSPLQHDLDEPQANDMLVLLHSADIQADKVAGPGPARWTLRVPDHQHHQAWNLLRAHGLPRQTHQDLEDEPLLPSASQERARLQHQRARQLETSLYTLPGVLTARVHLVLPAHDPLAQTQASPRASVLLLTHDPDSLPPHKDIQALLAGAVEDLQDNQVSLLIHQAPTPPTTKLPPKARTTLPHNALAALLVVILLQALAILWLLWRRRATHRQTHEPKP